MRDIETIRRKVETFKDLQDEAYQELMNERSEENARHLLHVQSVLSALAWVLGDEEQICVADFYF